MSGAAPQQHPVRAGPPVAPGRRVCPRGRLRHRTAATRHSQGIHLHFDGRRDGHLQRNRHAGPL